MTSGRTFILNKLDETQKKAASINCWWVCVFWKAPKELGGNIEVVCSYFEDLMDMQQYVSFKTAERKRVGLPYYINASGDYFYSEDFVKDLDFSWVA